MSIQSYDYDFTGDATSSFFDPRSGMLTRTGKYLLLALWNRTGLGTGIVPKLSPQPLVAAGASIDDALGLITDWNLVGTVAPGSGVQILPLKPGNDIQVYNADPANALNVYPPADMQIDALAINAPYVLNAGKLRIFECWTLTQLFSLGN